MNPSPVLLVTGAEGFLGSHITSVLKREGHTVIAGVHNKQAVNDDNVFLDVCDPGAINQVFEEYRPDHVIHCAAYGVNYMDRDVDLALKINIFGSLNLLDAASLFPVKRFIHLGSCFEYGTFDGPIPENTLPRPTDIYGSSKLAATILMLERSTNLNVPLVVLRPFGMWGPGEKAHRLVPQIINAHKNKTKLDLTSCNITRDYLFVEDVARIIVNLCLLSEVGDGCIINIGSGRPVVLKEFVLSIARVLDCEDLLNFNAIEHRPTEMKSLAADTSTLLSIIREFDKTSLEDGLKKMLSKVSDLQ